MRIIARCVAGMSLVGVLSGCTATTESTEVGVRVAKVPFLGGRGVVDTVYPQGGTYFFFRPLSDWYVFDVAIQNLVMTREPAEGDRSGDDSLRFKTIDGNDVSVNVTVAWSIEPSRAPHLLESIGRNTKEVEETLVRPVSRAFIRDILNKLTSEEYYQADKRFEMAEIARTRLTEIFASEGIAIQQVLLGEHRFNVEYEDTIRSKKVAEQEAEHLVSETEAAGEEQKRDLETAKGEVSKTVEAALGAAEQRKLEADAIFFERQQQSEALLAEKRARAEGLTAQARALAGAGGTTMVKLKVAEALKGKRVLFLPSGSGMDVRTTDMNALLQSIGVMKALPPKPAGE